MQHAEGYSGGDDAGAQRQVAQPEVDVFFIQHLADLIDVSHDKRTRLFVILQAVP